jgi:hypothetical protein
MEEEVKKDNEIIAEFMGEVLTEEDHAHNFTLDQLPYRTNWNWLIPVVEKIESLGGRTAILFSPNRHNICTISERDHTMLAQKESQTKIEAVYKAVVEFIRWYNTTQKSI